MPSSTCLLTPPPVWMGCPVELFRRAKSIFTPLLARLFTAFGARGPPSRFLDGVVVSLHKQNDRADPSNYRPITLLNGDYRAYAKVLANRLLRCMGRVISPEQTAYLRGRSIGANVLTLQLLAQQLAKEGRSALLQAGSLASCCELSTQRSSAAQLGGETSCL